MVDSDSSKDLTLPKLDSKRQQQAKEYARIRRYISLADVVAISILLGLLVFTGFSERIAGSFGLPLIPAAIIYFFILVATFRIITAPLSFYRG
jgi:hypothetical protein